MLTPYRIFLLLPVTSRSHWPSWSPGRSERRVWDVNPRMVDVAEGVGFEPTDGCPSSAFKALALGRYANPPDPLEGSCGILPVMQTEAGLPRDLDDRDHRGGLGALAGSPDRGRALRRAHLRHDARARRGARLDHEADGRPRRRPRRPQLVHRQGRPGGPRHDQPLLPPGCRREADRLRRPDRPRVRRQRPVRLRGGLLGHERFQGGVRAVVRGGSTSTAARAWRTAASSSSRPSARRRTTPS